MISAPCSDGPSLIVVPHTIAVSELDRIIISGTASGASRALADSLPFLHTPRSIDIVPSSPQREQDGEITGPNMRRPSRAPRHTVGSSTSPVAAPACQNAILAHAADTGADFMVLGGYGQVAACASSFSAAHAPHLEIHDGAGADVQHGGDKILDESSHKWPPVTALP